MCSTDIYSLFQCTVDQTGNSSSSVQSHGGFVFYVRNRTRDGWQVNAVLTECLCRASTEMSHFPKLVHLSPYIDCLGIDCSCYNTSPCVYNSMLTMIYDYPLRFRKFWSKPWPKRASAKIKRWSTNMLPTTFNQTTIWNSCIRYYRKKSPGKRSWKC